MGSGSSGSSASSVSSASSSSSSSSSSSGSGSSSSRPVARHLYQGGARPHNIVRLKCNEYKLVYI